MRLAPVLATLILFAPNVASAQALVCGSTITTDTVLTADLVCAGAFAGNAVTIGADGVTLDGNGFDIVLANGAAVGVRVLNVSDAVIDNLTVRSSIGNLGTGVRLQGTTRATIEDSTFANLHDGIGSALATTNVDTTIQRVSVAGNVGVGMSLIGLSGAVTLADNTFDGSHQGLALINAVGPFTIGGGNTFANVGTSATDTAIGILNSTDVTVEGVNLSGTIGRGVQVTASPRTALRNNTITGRTRGIYTLGTTTNADMEITGNNVSNSLEYGMYLDSVDAGLVLDGNTFDGSDSGLRLQDLAGPWALPATNTFAAIGNGTLDDAVYLVTTSDITIDGLDLSDTRGLGVGVTIQGTTGTVISNTDVSGRYRGIDSTLATNAGLVLTGNDASGNVDHGIRLLAVDSALVLEDNDMSFSKNGLRIQNLVGPWTLSGTNNLASTGTTATASALALQTVTDVTVSGLDISGNGLGYGVRLIGATNVDVVNNDLSGRNRAVFATGVNSGGSIRGNDASGAVNWSMWLVGYTGLDLGDNDHSGSANGLNLVSITGPTSIDLFGSSLDGLTATNAKAVRVYLSTDVDLTGIVTDVPNSGTGIEVNNSTNVDVNSILACDTTRGVWLVNGQNVTVDDAFLDANLYGVDIDAATDATSLLAVEAGGSATTLVRNLGTNTSGTATQLLDSDADGLSDLCDACPNDPDLTHLPPNCVDLDLCAGDDATGDADLDGHCADEDCDDNEPLAFPGNPEVCDGIDNNCVFGIDEGTGRGNDSDGDTCPDCFDPFNDGVDTDADGICDLGDDDQDNDSVANTADPQPLDCTICGVDGDLDTCDDCTVRGCAVGGVGTPTSSDDGTDGDTDGYCDVVDFQLHTGAGVLLQSVGWSTGGIGSPSVAYDRAAGQYVMVYETQTGTATGCKRGVWALGLATSSDGVNWTDSGGALLAPTTPTVTDYECVAAQPTIVQHDGGPGMTVFFKAEAAAGYKGIGSIVVQWDGSQYAVTTPYVNTSSITVNFGFPKAVWDNGVYRLAYTVYPNMFTTSGSATALAAGTQALSMGFASYAPGEVYSPAIACDASGNFVVWPGGHTLSGLTVTGWGVGRRQSDGTLSTISAGPEPLLGTGTGDVEWRHWDVLRVGTADYVAYYTEKVTTGVPLVRMARTSNLTDFSAIQDKACP